MLGAWRNGQRLEPAWPDMVRSWDALYAPSRFHRARRHIPWPGKVRALGSSAAHLAQVAAGGGLATVIPRWQLWDVGCGALLLEEVGGVLRTLDSRPFDPLAQPNTPFIAGAPAAIHHLERQD